LTPPVSDRIDVVSSFATQIHHALPNTQGYYRLILAVGPARTGKTLEFFETSGRNLLAAEAAVGEEIDLYLVRPYYIVPDGKVGHDPYAVIRETVRSLDLRSQRSLLWRGPATPVRSKRH
jgi:hypothetical protein